MTGIFFQKASISPSCGSPASMRDLRLSDLDDLDLTCQSPVLENYTSYFIGPATIHIEVTDM